MTLENDFASQMQVYRQAIEDDIEAYASHIKTSTLQEYGERGAVVTGAFLDMLSRGGKRLRGTLTMIGYELLGGQDRTMIVRAATALEMIHAYWLIIDDIQDRSSIRRGKPTVHTMLADYHRSHKLTGDANHTGISLALNAAVAGGHAAQMLLASLNVDAERRTKAMAILSQAAMITGHGQTYDIMNELAGDASLESIHRAMEWKTAYYTFLNPLCVGLVLANAGCEDTDAIRGYALAAGKAFQITDDIMGMFGEDSVTGKSSLDDLREGKQTLLTHHAFVHASVQDKAFLRECLGKPTISEAEAIACRQILEQTGSLAYAKQQAEKYVDQALTSLDNAPLHWDAQKTNLLRTLVKNLPSRVQ